MACRAWTEFLIGDGTGNDRAQICVSKHHQLPNPTITIAEKKKPDIFHGDPLLLFQLLLISPHIKSLVLFQYLFFPLSLHTIEFGIHSSQVIQKSFLAGI